MSSNRNLIIGPSQIEGSYAVSTHKNETLYFRGLFSVAPASSVVGPGVLGQVAQWDEITIVGLVKINKCYV